MSFCFAICETLLHQSQIIVANYHKNKRTHLSINCVTMCVTVQRLLFNPLVLPSIIDARQLKRHLICTTALSQLSGFIGVHCERVWAITWRCVQRLCEQFIAQILSAEVLYLYLWDFDSTFVSNSYTASNCYMYGQFHDIIGRFLRSWDSDYASRKKQNLVHNKGLGFHAWDIL